MDIGKKIQTRRLEKNMTQEQLAEKLFVTPQSVSQWENGRSFPDILKLKDIASVLGMSFRQMLGFLGEGTDDWALKNRLFQEDHMYSRLKAFAETEGLFETYRALPYMKEKHSGQYRKPSLLSAGPDVPYIIHPLMMACQAHALGLRDDVVLAVALLHDVCEDCGVSPDELPFSGEVREAVRLLSRNFSATEEEYFDGIRKNKTACIVKVLDRCNNVSTMAASFSDQKLIEYINETEELVYPLIDQIKQEYPEYSDAAFVLKYHIISVTETVKNMMMR